MGTTLYVNSIVMQKPSLKKNTGGGKSFTHKLVRKTKSIFTGLKKSDAGFWVYSPFTLPVHHISDHLGCLSGSMRCSYQYEEGKIDIPEN